MTQDNVGEVIEQKKAKLNQYVGSFNSLQDDIAKLEGNVKEIIENIVSTEKAIYVLQQYADFQQKEVTGKIEEIVTRGLISVFQDPSLKFHLHYSEKKDGEKKKAPEVTMSITYDHEGTEVRGDIKNSFGGGLAVVASTLLRIVITWVLAKS